MQLHTDKTAFGTFKVPDREVEIMNAEHHFRNEHGEAIPGQETIEYRAWQSMKDRCENPNATKFEHYGGRGIQVCERWKEFKNFLADVGRRPKNKTSLGRINNDGDYEPGNCEWQTNLQQGRNTRRVRLTLVRAREIRTLYGQGHTQWDLADQFKVGRSTIQRVVTNRCWREMVICN
jgi:helix-turn-helix resolvase-like protein